MTPLTPIESRLVHRGRVFELYRDRATASSGSIVELDVIRHPGAAAVVAIDERGDLLLLRQYRYALNRYIWEIPAGTLEPGESPISCARRELAEEAGVSAARWSTLGAITPLPGYSDEIVHLFLARELTGVSQRLDPDEFLEIHPVSWQTAMNWLAKGEIEDAKTIAGLCKAAFYNTTPGDERSILSAPTSSG
ncbi:MAG: NUDIX hydrolase [Desulfobacterales bacterium]